MKSTSKATSVLGTLLGVGAGLALAVGIAPLVGCSCPAGYKPKQIADGTYPITRAAAGGAVDAGAAGMTAFGHVVVTGKTVVHTVTLEGVVYEMTYQITGTRL